MFKDYIIDIFNSYNNNDDNIAPDINSDSRDIEIVDNTDKGNSKDISTQTSTQTMKDIKRVRFDLENKVIYREGEPLSYQEMKEYLEQNKMDDFLEKNKDLWESDNTTPVAESSNRLDHVKNDDGILKSPRRSRSNSIGSNDSEDSNQTIRNAYNDYFK